jgi:hypothetical protein
MYGDRKPAELTLTNGSTSILVRRMYPRGADPVICKTYDLGAPEFRYTTVANPGTDGTSYSDGFVGARTVTFELAIMGDHNPQQDPDRHDAYWYASRLAAMTHPMAKPVLSIERYDDVTAESLTKLPPNTRYAQTMQLRGAPYSLPYTSRSAALLEMQLVFTCPLGLIEGPPLKYTVEDTDPNDEPQDWVFPAKFDKKFGAFNNAFPRLIIDVGGDTAIAPTLYISGPCTNPEVLSGEDRFAFDGLILDAGQTVQVDMATGSVRLGTEATGTILDDMTVYNTVDWAVSTFWRWLPGRHEVFYLSTHGNLTIQFSERRLTV